jgi:hypothetical protein
VNFTAYATVSHHVTNIPAYVNAVTIQMGEFSGGTIVLIMHFVTGTYLLLNGLSSLAYYYTMKNVKVSDIQASSTVAVPRKAPFLFDYLYYQTVSCGIYYKSLLFMGITMSLGVTLTCAVLGLKGGVEEAGAALCSFVGIAGLALLQANSQITIKSIDQVDVVLVILTVGALLVAFTPWCIATSLLWDLASDVAVSQTPWLCWILVLSGWAITLAVILPAFVSIFRDVNWFIVEVLYMCLGTVLCLIYSASFFAGVLTNSGVDQNVAIQNWVTTAV